MNIIASIQQISRRYPSTATLVLGGASLAVVGTAWLFQIAGYLPCQLCLWQRIPYYVAGPILVLVGLMTYAGIFGRKVLSILVVFCGSVFVLSALLATYHSGVEWSFWQGPNSCGGASNFTTTDATDLLGALSTTRPPSCNEAAGRFLSLSFAGWNVIASAGLAFACFVLASAIFEKPQATK